MAATEAAEVSRLELGQKGIFLPERTSCVCSGVELKYEVQRRRIRALQVVAVQLT